MEDDCSTFPLTIRQTRLKSDVRRPWQESNTIATICTTLAACLKKGQNDFERVLGIKELNIRIRKWRKYTGQVSKDHTTKRRFNFKRHYTQSQFRFHTVSTSFFLFGRYFFFFLVDIFLGCTMMRTPDTSWLITCIKQGKAKKQRGRKEMQANDGECTMGDFRGG